MKPENFKRFKFLIKPVLFFLISVILVRILGMTKFPDTIFPSINSFFSKILYQISSPFKFSLGDIFYSILIVLAMLFLFFLGKAIWKRNFLKVKHYLSFLIYFL